MTVKLEIERTKMKKTGNFIKECLPNRQTTDIPDKNDFKCNTRRIFQWNHTNILLCPLRHVLPLEN